MMEIIVSLSIIISPFVGFFGILKVIGVLLKICDEKHILM